MTNDKVIRVQFSQLFSQGQNGSLILVRPIIIGSEKFPQGTVIDKDAPLGGVNFHDFTQNIFGVVELPSGTYRLKGVYLRDE